MNLQCQWKKWSSLLPCWHKHSWSHLATGHFDCQHEGWYHPSSPHPQMLVPTSSSEASAAFVQLCGELGQERWKWHGEGRTARFGCSADLGWIKMAALPEPGWTKWENWFRLQLISLSPHLFCVLHEQLCPFNGEGGEGQLWALRNCSVKAGDTDELHWCS